MNDLPTHPAECADCGKTFEAVEADFSALGASMKIAQVRCDDCCKIAEAKFQEMTLGKPNSAKISQWNDICPPCYQNFTPELLPVASQRVFSRVMGWTYQTRGLGLIGDSRTGKTFLIFHLLSKFHPQRSICHTTGPELAWAIGNPDQSRRRNLIHGLTTSDIAFIDDLGKEKITNTVEADLYHIAEQRRRNLKPLFVTVNSTGEELAARMSPDGGIPIINRLREDLCEFIAVK